METLGDLLARDRRTDDLAVRASGEPTVEYTEEDFVTTAWKTANFFSHRGVHEGATVAVVADPAVPPLLGLFGAVQLGGVVRIGPPDDVDAKLLVGPGEDVLAYDLPPGATRVAYTDGPDGVDDPSVEAFGRSVWSENPIQPPEEVDPGTPALATSDRLYTHRALLEAAERLAADVDLTGDVVLRAPLSDPRTVVAGVLAPLVAGGTVVFPDGTAEAGDVAVTDGSAPEPETVRLSAVRIESEPR